MSDKLKNVWTTIKTVVKDTAVFKYNDPKNTQERVTPLNKDFYKKPLGKKK